jgi:hypothetical protein
MPLPLSLSPSLSLSLSLSVSLSHTGNAFKFTSQGGVHVALGYFPHGLPSIDALLATQPCERSGPTPNPTADALALAATFHACGQYAAATAADRVTAVTWVQHMLAHVARRPAGPPLPRCAGKAAIHVRVSEREADAAA